MKSIAIALSWFLAAAPLAAQVIRGVVTDSASRQHISGAVVQLLAADGSVLTRTLTNRLGEYVLRSTNGTQLRLQRIGFRPRVVALAVTEESVVTLNVVMTAIPAFLEPVQVLAAQCGRRAANRRGARSAVALLEQARAGLLTTVVSRDVNPAAMTRYTFERTMDGTSDRVERQTVRVDSSPRATASFSAVHDASAFVRRGFLEDGGGLQTYFAPDADVLLDDRFAAGYCFRVMPPDRARPNQVGLGFDPANSRRGRVDITGALWIDTVTRELSDIEFRYIGLTARAEAYAPDGLISFRAMDNGVVVVDRWQLNLLGLRTDTLPSTTRPGARRINNSYFRHESGGVLGRAAWRDGTQWRASLGSVVGRMRDRTNQPLPNVLLALNGTPYRAVTDSLGEFVILDLVPGAYSAVVIDSALLTIGITMPVGPSFTVASDTVRLSIEAPTPVDFVIDRCIEVNRYNAGAPRIYILGRALTANGLPVEDVRWDIRQLGRDGFEEIAVNGRTGSDGLMPMCVGLAQNADIEIVATSRGGERRSVQLKLTEAANIFSVVF